MVLTDLLNGIKIYQYEDEFKFSVDAVLLSDFIEAQKNKKILEVGGGTGVISLLLYGKEKLTNTTIKILEIQRKMSSLIEKNIEMNKINDIIKVENIDFKEFKESNQYDVIFSNPPYIVVDGRELNVNEGKKISRHEIALTLEEFIKNSKRVLKPQGELYLIHRSYRLQEIMTLFSKYNFNIERIKFIHHKIENHGELVLIKALKGAQKILRIESPIVLKG